MLAILLAFLMHAIGLGGSQHSIVPVGVHARLHCADSTGDPPG